MLTPQNQSLYNIKKVKNKFEVKVHQIILKHGLLTLGRSSLDAPTALARTLRTQLWMVRWL